MVEKHSLLSLGWQSHGVSARFYEKFCTFVTANPTLHLVIPAVVVVLSLGLSHTYSNADSDAL